MDDPVDTQSSDAPPVDPPASEPNEVVEAPTEDMPMEQPRVRRRGRPKKVKTEPVVAPEIDHNFWTGMLQTHRDMLAERRTNKFASFTIA